VNLKSSYIFAGMKKNRSEEAVFPTIETSYGISGGRISGVNPRHLPFYLNRGFIK
jgi:hypothetical protein